MSLDRRETGKFFHNSANMVAERVEVSAEQRNLSPAAYKNADGSRRAAGRIIANMEYEKETKAYEQQADDAMG